MARCGCRGDACSCIVVAGRNARVTGSGNQNNPYIIDALPMNLITAETETIDLNLSGDGSPTTPWVLSANLVTGAMAAMWGRWTGTQAEYDALGTYDPATLYLVS